MAINSRMCVRYVELFKILVFIVYFYLDFFLQCNILAILCNCLYLFLMVIDFCFYAGNFQRMASNTLKDMNSLHVTEKIIDCKASLTKPCVVGKMNGKSEDRPLPNSASLDPTDPSVLVIEKPEPEKAIVEVEYIESENLDNVDDADEVLKVFSLIVLLCCYYINSH